MHWRRVALWSAIGLSIWLIALFTTGLVMGLAHSPSPEQTLVFVLGGLLLPLASFVLYFPIIAGSYLSAVIVWSFLTTRVPRVSSSRPAFVGAFTAYSGLVAILAWVLFPFEDSIAVYVGVVSFVSLVVPGVILAMPPARLTAA